VKIAALKLSKGTATEQALAYLQALPDDEVLTIEDVAKAIGVARSSLARSITDYGICVNVAERGNQTRRKWLLGNPKAIKALRKHYENL